MTPEGARAAAEARVSAAGEDVAAALGPRNLCQFCAKVKNRDSPWFQAFRDVLDVPKVRRFSVRELIEPERGTAALDSCGRTA